MKKILISGAAGFIGFHLVSYLLEKTDYDIVCLDRYDTSGNVNRLASYLTDDLKKRVKFVYHDLKAPINEFTSRLIGEVEHVIHLAASSHVDRSIEDPLSFVMDNVVGTTNLLIWAKSPEGMTRIYEEPKNPEEKASGKLTWAGKFLNFSTDEVFGPAEVGHNHKEDEVHKPSNPYSGSKSGQEAMGYSFFVTYHLPVITTHTMNNFGEMQHPEKLLPKTMRSVKEGTPMPIFAELKDGELVGVGSRFWIHSRNTASAVLFLLEKGVAGESYNIIGFDELTNLEIAQKVADIMGKPLIPKFVDFHATRPGHDRRYSLDGTKMREMGWKPEVNFEDSLKKTVEWTLVHDEWI
jgi:dTDP-glucose 4,6-dehydratase